MLSLSETLDAGYESDFVDVITEICSRVDYFFAALPICSCLFYVAAFKKVRSVRRFRYPVKETKIIIPMYSLYIIAFSLRNRTRSNVFRNSLYIRSTYLRYQHKKAWEHNRFSAYVTDT
nr:unnamed protein product [Haemonchus contortus]